MRTKGTGTGRDVLELLAYEDEEIEQLLGEYFGPRAVADHAVRGAIGKKLIDRLSVQDVAKEEVIHELLAQSGREDLVASLGQHARERRELVAELDELSSGVSPRDVHVGQGARFDETVHRLCALLGDHLQFERERVIPAIRAAADPGKLEESRHRVEKVKKRAPTHPRPSGAPVRQLNRVSRRLKAIYDRLRDYPPAEGASGRRGS
jgi:hypothetical protein